MTDFKPIETQEEFDSIIKKRIAQADKKARDEFAGWVSPEDVEALKQAHKAEIDKLTASHADELKKYEGYDEKFTAQQTRIHELEVGQMKTKIAIDKKLPLDAIEFLRGDDEKSINESADKLSKLSAPKNLGFTKNTESPAGNSVEAGYRELAAKFTSN